MACSSNAEQVQVQAAFLARLAQEARLVRFALEAQGERASELAGAFERAIEMAIDADEGDERRDAELALALALADARAAGLAVSANLSDLEVEGVLGAQRLRVLTAVMAPWAERRDASAAA